MITIPELRALIDSNEYQQLCTHLAEKYQLDVRYQRHIQGYNIDCKYLSMSGLTLDELYACVQAQADVIAIILQQRELTMVDDDPDVTDSYYAQSIFLHIAADILMVQDLPRLSAYCKAIHRPAPTKYAKEIFQEYQQAQDIFAGVRPAGAPTPKPKPKPKRTIPITLGELAPLADEPDVWGASVTLWDKPAQLLVYGMDDTDSIHTLRDALSEWLTWLDGQQDEIVTFALGVEDFVDTFNDWVVGELERHGRALLSDGTALTATVTDEMVTASIAPRYISVSVCDGCIDDVSLDLDSKPDYFGGHLLCVEFDMSDGQRRMHFGGMNG